MISRNLAVIVLASLTGTVFYFDAISTVLSEVLNRSDSSHGVFVPLLTVYFFWTIKDRLRQTPIKFSWIGIPLIIFCLGISLSNIWSYQINFIFFIFFVAGLVLMLLGTEMLRTTAFPILFLITMTPIPPDLYDKLANLSRTIAFGGSLKIISLFGISHFRTGWDIEFPEITLKVGIGCSGIRYLISFFVFGLAYAYLFRRTTIGRIITILATIPISIFSSILRLTIIFMMTYWISPFWGQHKPHVILSWFVFLFVLFSIILIDQAVQKRREGFVR